MAVDVLISAFGHVGIIDHFEETVHQASSHVLAQILGVDIALQLERVAVETSLVAEVVHEHNTNDLLVDELGLAVVVASFRDRDKEGEAFFRDPIDPIDHGINARNFELWGTNSVVDVVAVKTLE